MTEEARTLLLRLARKSRDGLNGTKMACGTVLIAPAAGVPSFAEIDYARAGFSSAPVVLATARTALPGSQVVEVGVTDLTATTARICLYRTNTTATAVNWVALEV